MKRIFVAGSGSWGLAIAKMAAEKGHAVTISGRSEEKAKELILRVCRNFDDYDPSVDALESVRREVLELLG